MTRSEDSCSNCLVQFLETKADMSAHPESRSVLDDGMCLRCSIAAYKRRVPPDADWKRSFSEMLSNAFTVLQIEKATKKAGV